MEPQHDLEFGARVEEHVGAPSGITIASAGIAGLAASVLALSLAVNMLRGSLGQAPAAAGLTAFCAAIGAAYVALVALQSPTSSGEPALDGEFVFATTDARAAVAAAPILSQLDPALRAYGIHLVCADGWLRFVFDRGRFGGSLYFAEQLVWALEHVADRMEALASAAPAPTHSRAAYEAPRTMRSR